MAAGQLGLFTAGSQQLGGVLAGGLQQPVLNGLAADVGGQQ